MNRYQYFGLLAMILLLLASSCVKDPEPTGGDDDDDATTTSIQFTAIKDSLPLADVFVGITPNQADRDNGIYLFTQTTGTNGRVLFEDLEAITYWYTASYSASGSPGGPVVRKGSITLEKGDEVKRELNF